MPTMYERPNYNVETFDYMIIVNEKLFSKMKILKSRKLYL